MKNLDIFSKPTHSKEFHLIQTTEILFKTHNLLFDPRISAIVERAEVTKSTLSKLKAISRKPEIVIYYT